ncbi:hypothetical protein ACEPPN_018883 [Leptodophora sp. 'Broadleaf-Isolate-01']
MSEQNTPEAFVFYQYDPSLAAAVIFTFLFFGTSTLHVYQLSRTRTWYFTALVLGGIMEAIGYVGRILSSRQSPNWTLGPFIIQAMLLLIAPALFAASIYMILGRIVLALDGEKHCLIKKKWLTKIFVAGDVVSFLVLSGGSGLQTNKDINVVQTGERVILAGLLIQVVFFGVFMLVALLFHQRILRDPTHASMSPNLPWQKHLHVLYIVSALIMIRSVVRVVEYIQGFEGYILSHEAFLYIFDGLLMFIALAIFNWIHPSELIPGKGRGRKVPSRDVSMNNL